MLTDLHKRVKKAGQPPGTPVYTGDRTAIAPQLSLICYDPANFHETTTSHFDAELIKQQKTTFTWLNIVGLHDTALVGQIAKHYNLHPLTVEDILNVEQRSKIEHFNDYIFITLKMLFWHPDTHIFSVEQLNLIIGKTFVLSFQEVKTPIFNAIRHLLRVGPNQYLREKGSDYLAYRLIDAVVDQYFGVLEEIGDQIESLEERIISNPTPENSHALYRLKHKILLLRKAIWPMREVISHLLQVDEKFVSPFTRLYVRDVYDHIVQAIDTLETFRDMLASILDIYLSSLTTRMNEIMKVLTIIATIFIPITFIASVFGMNFKYMPELNWYWGYPGALALMVIIVIFMVCYFRRKKWL